MPELDYDIIRLPHPGESIALTMESTGIRYEVTWIGMVFEKSVLVTAPHTPEGLVSIERGDRVAIRYFKDNHINGFRVRVLHLARAPFAYLHLEYPTSIADHRVRTAPRVGIHLPARIALDDGHAETEIIDLSDAGARLSMARDDIEVGSTFQLQFELEFAGQTESMDIPCEVKNRNAPEKGQSKTYYGVAFKEVDKIVRVILSGFVYEQLSKQRANL